MDAILTYEQMVQARVIPGMLAINKSLETMLSQYLHEHTILPYLPEVMCVFFFLYLQIQTRQPPKMTSELSKKAKTPAKRSGLPDLQTLQEQFAAQLKSPKKGLVLKKGSKNKKKQKVTESDQVRPPNVAGKDVLGHQISLTLVRGHVAQP